MAKKVDLMRPIIFLCVIFLSLLSSFFPAAGQKSDPCYKNWVDSARNAIKAGHSVVLFEKNTRIGGIWNPWSGGAYRNACMQNSRYTFHYTGFPPGDIDERSWMQMSDRVRLLGRGW